MQIKIQWCQQHREDMAEKNDWEYIPRTIYHTGTHTSTQCTWLAYGIIKEIERPEERKTDKEDTRIYRLCWKQKGKTTPVSEG